VPGYSDWVLAGFSLYEGYVIDALIENFTPEFEKFKLMTFLNILKSIAASEGAKSAAKGTFEAVVLDQLLRHKGKPLSAMLEPFGINLDGRLNLCLPSEESKYDDDSIISKRPEGVFLRPSTMFPLDILAFLSNNSCLSVGIKLYSSNIALLVHEDNLASTDPCLFFSKKGRPTDEKKQRTWQDSLSKNPVSLSVRFLLEFPGPAGTVQFKNVHEKANGIETVIIMVTKSNMRDLFSSSVCDLLSLLLGID
jgi:hypothetical protein